MLVHLLQALYPHQPSKEWFLLIFLLDFDVALQDEWFKGKAMDLYDEGMALDCW